jgi:hypothetical protein
MFVVSVWFGFRTRLYDGTYGAMDFAEAQTRSGHNSAGLPWFPPRFRVSPEMRSHDVYGFQGQVNFGGFGTREASNHPMAKLNEYVKTAEAAAILGISQNRLRGWTDAGKIRCHRNPANGYRLFAKRPGDVPAYRRGQRNQATSEDRPWIGANE